MSQSQQLSKAVQVHIPATATSAATTTSFKCPSYWTVSEIEKKIRATFMLDGGCLLHNEVALTDTVPVIMLPEGSLSFKYGQIRTTPSEEEEGEAAPAASVAPAAAAVATKAATKEKRKRAPKGKGEEEAGSSSGKKKQRAAEDDENKPEKAKSPYIVFCKEKRAEVKAKHPEASFGEMGRILGQVWNELDEKTKDTYIKKAYSRE